MSEGTPARVLVVNDDAAVRGLLEQVLGEHGWVVQTAADAPGALAACERSAFAVIMIGLHLRGTSGAELAAIIGKRWPAMAVVMVSAAEDLTTTVGCIRAGDYNHLTKRFDLIDLVVHVDRALERRRLLLVSERQEAGLEAQVRRQTQATRRLFLGVIESLSSALEAKDDYTRGHSERVSRLGQQLALMIGAGPEEVESIGLGGRLHDIGKIGVRESVLSKPSSLTEEERQHVQTHPAIGERILAPVLMDVETAGMVRNHHEHYGGGGYPDGLRGSAIPLGARVLAVADAFDALTSDRPYRARLSTEAAIGVLRAGAGSQWQPAIVEALVRHVENSNGSGAGR